MHVNIITELTKASKPVAVFEENNTRRFVSLDEGSVVDNYKNMKPEEFKEMIFGSGSDRQIIEKINAARLNEKYVTNDGKMIKINNKSMMFLPDFSKERELILIFGPSGSGKSFLTSKFVNEFKKGRPDYDVFLFSRLEDDPSLKFEYTHVPLDPMVLAGVDVESLENSVVIFDDTETPNDKTVMKLIDNLKDLISMEGRHYNITMIITTHQACNYNRTRLILNECQKYVIFPQGNGKKQMENMFCKYGGLSKNQFEQVKQLNTRWCMLNTSYPNYIVFENGLYLT
jgi:hypothetical protein